MRSVGLLWTLAIVFGTAAAGCGGSSSGTVSCTTITSVGADGGTSLQTCEEVSGLPQSAESVEQSCTASNSDAGIQVVATFANGPCSHVDALGGCRFTANGASVTEWYYSGTGNQTSADIQAMCASAGATFIAP